MKFCTRLQPGKQIILALVTCWYNLINTIMKAGKYQHFKGKLYRVLGVAKHSETFEEYVVYESLYDKPESKMWIRSKKMFNEKVETNGIKQKRFKIIKE